MDLPPAEKPLTNAPSWFGTEPAKPGDDSGLGGEWAEGIDAAAAAVPVREGLVAPRRGSWYIPLLEGENTLVLDGNLADDSGEVLVVANGSFLVNGGLLNRARRPLAKRVTDWIGQGGHRVVFVEGRTPRVDPSEKGSSSRDDEEPSSSGLAIPTRGPLGMIVPHFLALGVLACLYFGTRLGRARGEPPPGVGKPSLHAEALGDLLAKTRNPAAAQSLLDAYHRWRTPDRPPPS